MNDILCDRYDENIVYAAFNNHKNGDFKPYILKSIDKGKSWTSITGDLPQRGSVYCLEQDHENKNLLFAGTEFGVFFTTNGGKKWVKIGGGLPTIGIRDMEIQKRENDLVLASFGRGFYILDDYSPLRTIADTSGSAAHIFPIKDALAFNVTNPLGTRGKASQGESFFTTPNPPIGATFTYFLSQKPQTLEDQRRAAEKKIRKDKGDVSYPSFDALRNEDLELTPYLIFAIKDKNGSVVSRYKEEKLTQLVGPEKFKIKLLHDGQISKPDYAALTAFIEELNEGRRQVMSTTEEFKELKSSFDYIQNTVLKAPQADINILADLDIINKDLNDISVALYGDRSIRKRESESYPGLVFRVEVAAGNIFEHTEAPTQSEQRSFQIAMEEHKEVRASFEKAKSDIEAISKKLKDAKAPYFKH